MNILPPLALEIDSEIDSEAVVRFQVDLGNLSRFGKATKLLSGVIIKLQKNLKLVLFIMYVTLGCKCMRMNNIACF